MSIMIGLAGADNARKTTEKELNLGTPCLDDANKTWVYVRHHAACAAAAVVAVNASTFLTEAGTGYTNGATAAAINEYGWVRKTTTPL